MNKKLKLWELDRKSPENFRAQQKFPIVVILDDIRSLNNVGSFFRTADAFNVTKIILGGITACPPHKDIRKTALGSTDTVDWEYAKHTMDVVNKLKSEDNAVIVITHYQRLLDYIIPDFVHVLHDGKIVKSGDASLALELEAKGYDWIKQELV